MNNSVLKYASPCNRVETKRWLAAVPAFPIVCASPPTRSLPLHGASVTVERPPTWGKPLTAGRSVVQSSLSSGFSGKLSISLSVLKDSFASYRFLGWQFPPLYILNTATQPPRFLMRNLPIIFDFQLIVFVEILFILLVTSKLLVGTRSMSQILQIWSWPRQNSEARYTESHGLSGAREPRLPQCHLLNVQQCSV